MATRACQSCGAMLPADARFCMRCGTQVAATPPPAATPHVPPSPPQPVVVELPNWVTTDWAWPLKAALGTVGVGLSLLAAAVVLLVIAAAFGSLLSPFPTKGVLAFPPSAWLAFHGAVESDGLSMTGIVWIAISAMLARRLFLRGSVLPSGATPQQAVWIGAAKTAVVYGAVMLALAFIARALIGDFGEVGFFVFGGARINPIAAFFLGALTGFLIALWMLLKAFNLRAAQLVGLNIAVQLPESFAASLRGLRRVLVIGIGAMLALIYIAYIVDLGSSNRDISAAHMLAIGMQGFVLLLLEGIDFGWGWFVYGTRFFIGDRPIPNALFLQKPGWIYVGIAIPMVAMLAGGIAAAKSLRERTQQRAIEAGAFIALELVVFGLVAGLFWTRLGGGFVAESMFLPALWAVLAIAGALLTVQGAVAPVAYPPAGYPPAYQPPPAWTPPTPPAPAQQAPSISCPACGSPNAAGNVFCERCGARF